MNIQFIISISLSLLAIVFSFFTYLKHDKKLKEQDKEIKNFQLKKYTEEENEK